MASRLMRFKAMLAVILVTMAISQIVRTGPTTGEQDALCSGLGQNTDRDSIFAFGEVCGG